MKLRRFGVRVSSATGAAGAATTRAGEVGEELSSDPAPGESANCEGITIGSFSCALKGKLQPVGCLTLIGTEGTGGLTLNPNGSFTLTGLLRGRRGTDVFVEGHQPGELFVLLDLDDVETLLLPLGELGLVRSWRAVGFGSLFEDAEIVVQSHGGLDLMPLAPVHLTGSRNGADDLTLTWQRRTRIGGEWRDGTGSVPLGEASEAYEVDILDGPDGAVLRTLCGLASPAAVYTAAAKTTDFGAPQATIHLRVFQLSATIGRGFPASAGL